MTIARRRCCHCRRILRASSSASDLARTRDHIHPRSQGGRVTMPCCAHCNILKGDLTMAEWEWFMERYPQWWERFPNTGRSVARMVRRLRAIAGRTKGDRVP